MDLFSVVQALAALILLYATMSFAVTAIEVAWAFSMKSRSKHLRKGIETLIGAGRRGNNQMERERIRKFTNALYEHPSIDTLTLEDGFGTDRKLGKTKEYAPSSIPSSVFTAALTEILRLDWIAQKIVETRLERFSKRLIGDIERINSRLIDSRNVDEKHSKYFREDVLNTLELFKTGKLTVENSIISISNYLDIYIASYEETSENKSFLNQLKSLRGNFFGKDVEYIQLSFGLKPNLVEVIDAIDINSPIYSEIRPNINDKSKVEELFSSVPESLINSLRSVARRSQENNGSLASSYQEIDTWYSRAIQGEDNIYKRKTRTSALIISLILVVVMNIDAFNFISNYTYRYDVRDVLVSRIKQKSEDKRDPTLPASPLLELEKLSGETQAVLDSFPSPIGWSSGTIFRQFNLSQDAMSGSWAAQEMLRPGPYSLLSLLSLFIRAPLKSISIFVGWIISAGAISMGGPFWLDLFSKFVNIKR